MATLAISIMACTFISYTYLLRLSLMCSFTPNRRDVRILRNLQHIETELKSLAALQHQGSRDIQELSDEIMALKEDVSTLLANMRPQSSSTRVKILSVSTANSVFNSFS